MRILLSFYLLISCIGAMANPLDLDQMREEILEQNLDTKIQFERFYQAQQTVSAKLGDFIPGLSIETIMYPTNYLALTSIVPTASGWFNYQASKDFAIAEQYVLESVKLNILKDLSLTFVAIKNYEKIKSLMVEEEKDLEVALEKAIQFEQFGIGDEKFTFVARRALLQHKQDMYLLDVLIETQYEALMTSLDRKPEQRVELGSYEINTELIPNTVEEAIVVALNNAPELDANAFMIAGANDMTSAARYSFISFSGIGFDYPANVAIKRSEARELILEGEKTRNQIENQVALAYSKQRFIDSRKELQAEALMEAQDRAENAKELFDAGHIDHRELLSIRRYLYSQERAYINLEQESVSQKIETIRLLGLDASIYKYDITPYENAELEVNLNGSRFGRKNISIDIGIDEELKKEIVSVVYGGDIFDKKLMNINGNFSLFTKVKASGTKLFTAEINLSSGDTITLTKEIEL